MSAQQPSYAESIAALRLIPTPELVKRLRNMRCPPNISLHELILEAARRLEAQP